jgi:hypothetical protein
MLALLDDSGAGWRDVLDLARGLIVERSRALCEPGRHPKAILAVISIGNFAIALGLSLAASGLGRLARASVGSPPEWWDPTAIMAQGVAVVGWGVHSMIWASRHTGLAVPPPMPLRALAPWIAALLLGVVLASWTETIRPSHHALALPVLVHAIGWRHTRWRIQAAMLQLSSCRHEMKWALMERNRCERLTAQGLPAPLDEARANIVRIQTKQEETRASLHAMGYRATLRRR